jgi:hypothetical protein
MTWAAGIPIVGAIANGFIGSNAQDKATSAQVNAGRDAQANAQGWYDTAKANYQPYTELGQQGIAGLGNLSSNPSSALQADPGYQFRLDQGMQALQRSAAARGGLLSGGTLKGLTDYSQGQASQEFGNAWNRQAGLAQMGQQAAGSLTNVGNAAMGQQNNDITGVGATQAAGTIAKSNLWGNVVNSVTGSAAKYFGQ